MLHRIEWAIGKGNGHGDWHENTAVLDTWVTDLNKKYGAGSHWIQTTTAVVAS